MFFLYLGLVALLPLLTPRAVASPYQPSQSATNTSETPCTRKYFYVGGSYQQGENNTNVMAGQMYVEQLTPVFSSTKRPYPLVFVHGAGQTGTNWLNTPDGREGWSSYFLSQGYTVYIVDQTARGRSIYQPKSGQLTVLSSQQTQEQFTAPQLYDQYPQAHLHTQWPGNGTKGDPIFDAFYASQVQFLTNTTVVEHAMQAAGAALLDRIGNAILIMHSQAGAFPWLWADARPALVKAIVAVEPSGPPFKNAPSETPTGSSSNKIVRPYGLTTIPLTYSPTLTSGTELKTQVIPATAPGLDNCTIQAEPARQLPHLQGFPVLVTTSQASYHAPYDYCTAKYLQQAGVNTTYYRYEDFGIYGNGHLHFLEKNNLQIAQLLESWIGKI